MCFVVGSDKWTSLERKLFNKALATYSKDFIFVQKMVSMIFPIAPLKLNLGNCTQKYLEIFGYWFKILTKRMSSTLAGEDGSGYRGGMAPVLGLWEGEDRGKKA